MTKGPSRVGCTCPKSKSDRKNVPEFRGDQHCELVRRHSKAALPSEEPASAFAQDVVKNVQSMHSVLSKQLPPEQSTPAFFFSFFFLFLDIPKTARF